MYTCIHFAQIKYYNVLWQFKSFKKMKLARFNAYYISFLPEL